MTRKGKFKILHLSNLKKSSKNLFLPCERKMVKNKNPCPSGHLCKNNYGFHDVQDILKKKQKQLKSIWKGNRPNTADLLSDEDIDTFYSQKVLGIHSPRVLLNSPWINNGTFFGMRSGKEPRDLCWGDLQLKTDSEGNHLIDFNIERQTKTRTGKNLPNIREKKPKMYED